MNILLLRAAAAVLPALLLGCPVSAAPSVAAEPPAVAPNLPPSPVVVEAPASPVEPVPVEPPEPPAAELAPPSLPSPQPQQAPGAATPELPLPVETAESAEPAETPETAPVEPPAAELPEPALVEPAPEPPEPLEPPEPVEAAPAPKKALGIDWDLLWTGSWAGGGNLTNRADMKLSFAGFALRGELLDRRPGDFKSLWALPWKNEEANTAVLGGLYHPATGSRIIYGPLEDWGLSARLRSPWSRALPFAESRKVSMADLRTSPSTKEPELYVYLGSPYLRFPDPKLQPQLRGFVAARLNPAIAGDKPELTAGLEGRVGKIAASLEGFYAGGELPARKASAWFSETPPLPARSFNLYGLGLLFSIPYVRLSADGAWSETFAYGSDLYTNLGISVGNKTEPVKKRSNPRWQLSLAADGAGLRYTGSDGGNPGAGFRAGGKFELQQEKAGLFRINTSLSGPGIDEDFNRSSSGLSYRPPASRFPLRLSRISFTADRDARDAGHVKDSVGISLGLAANPREIADSIVHLFSAKNSNTNDGDDAAKNGAVALSFSGALTGSPVESPAGDILPWPIPKGPYRFESAKAGGQFGWSTPVDLGALLPRGTLELKAGLDYTISATVSDGETSFKESGDLNLSAVLRGKRNRVGLKIACPDFLLGSGNAPEVTLSWKVVW